MNAVLAEIPPDVRPVLEAYYQRKLAEKFGASTPGREEEAAFARELTAASESVVPMMNGGEAVITTGGGEWNEGAFDAGASASQGAERTRNVGAFVVLVVVAALFFFGRDLAGLIGLGKGGGGDDGEGAAVMPTPEALFTPVALPAGLDDIVSATGVRVPLVAPVTLEISGAFTTTTLPILPVQVKVADWPCPRQEQPVACWVYGTVVNYLVGVPADRAPALIQGLRPGDAMRLRFSTERSMTFSVERVQDLPRQQVEALRQRQPGLTLVFLAPEGAGVLAGGEDDTRRVVWATYDAGQDLFGAEVPLGGQAPVGGQVPVGGQAPVGTQVPAKDQAGASPGSVGEGQSPLHHTLGLGLAGTLTGARVTPVAAWSVSGQMHLRLLVENVGETALSTSGWSVSLNRQEEVVQGTIEEKQILSAQADSVLCTVPVRGAAGGAGAWEIVTDEAVFVVEP